MTLPYSLALWFALIAFIVLVGFAAAHVIQGFRFANHDAHILSATLTFILCFVVITGLSLILIRNVNWQGSWTLDMPTLTENTTP